MSESSESGEKTEDPTPQRLEKAREDGQVPRSKELTSLAMLAGGWGLLWLAGERLARQLATLLGRGLRFDHHFVNDSTLMLPRLGQSVLAALSGFLPVVLGLAVIGIASSMLLSGFLLSSKSISFDVKRLNPLSGLKRLFSAQVLSELMKSLLKVCLVGGVSYFFICHHWSQMMRLIAEPISSAIGDALSLAAQCVFIIVLSLLPLAGYDLFYQYTHHIKKLRMSRQEIKDEFKKQEGDPHVKQRIRQQQRRMAQGRMMADVVKADVIVNNPTHYSVALQYVDKKMSAPKVLAKGAGEVALRIRELGNTHNIPLLEAPALARALYRHAEIGKPIPAALYAAVAEVLAWVFGLRRWRHEGGLRPRDPKNLPVPPALDFAGEKTTDG